MIGLGLGLGLTSNRPPARPKMNSNGGPELLLQAELIYRGPLTSEGIIIRAAALPWLEIAEHLKRDSALLKHFSEQPRKFEEFIAATYEQAGFDEVILTPQRGDKGRDVIATKRGFGSVRFLDQTKAYSPGHLVSHDDIRAMLGVLTVDQNSSKGLITTTSDFQPGIRAAGSEFEKLMPHRLELKNGKELIEWIQNVRDDPPSRGQQA